MADALVAGAGTSAANGTYTYTGQYNGKPYFNTGGTDPTQNAVAWNSGFAAWVISGSTDLYVSDGADVALPWLATFTVGGHGGGDSPAPTVTATNTVQAGNSVLVQIALDATAGGGRVGFTTPPTMLGGGAIELTQGVANEAPNNIWAYNYYYNNVGNGGTGVTFTLDTAVPVAVNASEWHGLADAGPSATGVNSASDTTPSATGSTPAANALSIASYATVGNNYQSGPTGGWTRMTPANVTGIFLESAYVIGTGSSPTWTLDSAVDWSTIAATFGGA